MVFVTIINLIGLNFLNILVGIWVKYSELEVLFFIFLFFFFLNFSLIIFFGMNRYRYATETHRNNIPV